MKKALAFVLLLAMASKADATFKDTDIINRGEEPLQIIVPYFKSSTNELEILTLSLDKGDAYFKGDTKKHINGTVHKRYGLMPEIASNSMQRLSSNMHFKFHTYEKYKEVQKSNDFVTATGKFDLLWQEEAKYDYNHYFMYFQESTNELALAKLKLKSLDKEKREDFLKGDYLDCCFDNFYFGIVTNTPADAFQTLNDPKADSDGDGLSNQEEYCLGTNPLIRDFVVISPSLLEIPTDKTGIITNEFSVRNLYDEDLICSFGLEFGSHSFLPWNPKIISLDKEDFSSDNMKLHTRSRSCRRFGLVMDSDNLPACFCNINAVYVNLHSSKNYKMSRRIQTMRVFIAPVKKPDVIRPVLEYPSKGARMLAPWSGYLSWSDKEKDELMKIAKKEDRVYHDIYSYMGPEGSTYAAQVFKLLDDGKTKTVPTMTYGSNITYDYKRDRKKPFAPGLYFWRICKKNCMNYPVASDWSWFSVGEEVRPEMAVTADDKTTGPSQLSK